MKRIALILMLAGGLLAGCHKTVHTYMPDTRWVQVDADGYNLRATLTFSDRLVDVQGTTSHSRPLFDGLFDYYMNSTSDRMVIYYYDEYYDGETTTTEREEIVFDVQMRKAGMEMTLIERENLLGSRKLHFRRLQEP